MNPIAFIHTVDSEEQAKWLKEFSVLLPGEHIVLPESLTDDQARRVEVAIVANPDVEVLKRFPNLIWVHSLWAGVEGIVNTFRSLETVVNSTKNSTQLVRLIDPNLAKTMAEAVLTWTLYLYRNIPEYMAQQKLKLWQPIPFPDINTVQVSVLGAGELGTASSSALANQGFCVNTWSRGHKEILNATHYSGTSGLRALLQKTDILICLLPLTEQTYKLLNKEAFHLLPKGARFINFGRGAIINHDDLLDALDEGHLAHAVLDVFEQEPLPQNSPLWQHPKISILPHISAPTNVETAAKIVAKNILRYREDGTIPVSVDLAKGY